MDDARPSILIVDDQPANLAALRIVLAPVDADVVEAGSGNAALAKCLDRDFALILLDVHMPDMDGFEVAEFLRGEQRTSAIPIIFITAAYKDDNHRLMGYDVGAVDYIEKPINNRVLLSKVSVFLDLFRQARELRRLLAEVEETNRHLVAEMAERRAAEDALREAHDQLERRVAERTRELTDEVQQRRRAEENLREATEIAELANRAKSEFLSVVSHELRTPLNAIIGFSELVRLEVMGEIGNPVYSEYIDHIYQSGHHLLDLINDILDVSRIEAGQLDLVEEALDLESLLESCLLLVRSLASAGEIRTRSDIPPDLPMLVADARRVKQIVVNLLSNAIKFTPVNGTVTVAAGRDAEGGLFVKVADTGVGIAAEDQQKIMTPFGLAGDPMTRNHDGAGLGLPLAKRLTELHGGRLVLVSTPGQGTTVLIRFPPQRTAGSGPDAGGAGGA